MRLSKQNKQRLVFDIEGNGLREDITKVWCIVTKDIDTGIVEKYPPFAIDAGILQLQRAGLLIGHNIISYDIPVLTKLHGASFNTELYDTLVVSRLLNPDRQGGHSLKAWGNRLDKAKVEHDEWDKYSVEMLNRCAVDVELNYLVYLELEKERASG